MLGRCAALLSYHGDAVAWFTQVRTWAIWANVKWYLCLCCLCLRTDQSNYQPISVSDDSMPRVAHTLNHKWQLGAAACWCGVAVGSAALRHAWQLGGAGPVSQACRLSSAMAACAVGGRVPLHPVRLPASRIGHLS